LQKKTKKCFYVIGPQEGKLVKGSLDKQNRTHRKDGRYILRTFGLKGTKSRVARWFVFKPKLPVLGKTWRALEWKMLLYFIYICNVIQPFGKNLHMAVS
jgi:hypothetical protein